MYRPVNTSNIEAKLTETIIRREPRLEVRILETASNKNPYSGNVENVQVIVFRFQNYSLSYKITNWLQMLWQFKIWKNFFVLYRFFFSAMLAILALLVRMDELWSDALLSSSERSRLSSTLCLVLDVSFLASCQSTTSRQLNL